MLDCNGKKCICLSVILNTWEDIIFVLLVVILSNFSLELLGFGIVLVCLAGFCCLGGFLVEFLGII